MKVLRYSVELKPTSSILIGGKKLNKNYIKSMEYISGSVVRAALSREVLQRCSYFDSEALKKRGYWVEYLDKEECKNCKLMGLCKHFSEIKINTFYPNGSSPYPITNMRCKYNSDHENVDTLIFKIKTYLGQKLEYNNICPHENCNSRLEKNTGLQLHGKDVEPVYNIVTKNRIDPYKRASKEGFLYSLDTLANKVYIGNQKKDLIFEGEIISPTDEEILSSIDVLRVGAYTSAGFGKCVLKYNKIDDDEQANILERIEKFNNKINSNKTIIPFTLMADAYLGLEEMFDQKKSPAGISIDEYKEKYKEILKNWISEDLELEMVIATHELRRGFDTSKPHEVLRNSKIVTKAGSVLVFSAKDEIKREGLIEIQKTGIGNNTEHGFGQIKICHEFHYENAMKNEGVK